jgi:type VI secretion system secreted protein VgrG
MIRRGQSGGRAPDGASFQERDMDHHQAVRTLAAQLSGSGGSFDTITRLHHLELEGSSRRFLIEAFCKREELNQAWRLEISVLSLRVGLDLDEMVGKRANLRTTLSDGSEFWCSGLVIQAAADDSDGGFARYRLIVVPWVELLKHTRRSQAWQEKSVIEILESVFSQYSAYASWRWADCVAAHLDKSPHNCTGKHRSYVLQHKQSDWDFVARIMAEEHLIFRFERDEGAPLGHTMVILADTVDPKSCPEDTCSASPLGGQGIRYHRSGIIEDQDTIQAIGGIRQLPIKVAVLAGWDFKAKRVISATVPTLGSIGGDQAPGLEDYDWPGAYPFATSAQADRAAVLVQEAHEARHKHWIGRSTVRSFEAGFHFHLTESALDVLAALGQATGRTSDDRRFLLTRVVHAGISNLPKSTNEAIVTLLHEGGVDLLADWVPEEVRQQVAQTGYANHFETIRASVPWRPALRDDTGKRLNPKPTAPSTLVATVVGPDDQEIHMDALGRIRVRFDFQTQPMGPDTTQSSTWLRVQQSFAGPGMGLQFIPRIGQQVLIAFWDNDIDRPYVLCALYDGRGEGGVPATPGGKPGTTDTSVFAKSSDHNPSAQGNLTGGHSPAWHGASAADVLPGAGQRNSAAISGWKLAEYSGIGFTQLAFDDSNNQQRMQLAVTQNGTQLNLGHLIHQADNHRGSFRGLGFELRTDAYGAIRGGRGVILSTYGQSPSEPAGDLAAAMALAKQLEKLGQVMSNAAKLHETVKLAGDIGSHLPGKSFIDEEAPPFKAMRIAVSGMVDEVNPDRAEADAIAKNITASDDKLPHTTDPIVAVAAKAGLSVNAGQDLQLSAQETISSASGQDTHLATGANLRIHTGQAIGMLAGAIGPGKEAAGKGITLIAAKKDIEIQAQDDTMQIAAKGNLLIESENGHIDFAAAKRITLRVAGGASITIEGGNITHACPGTFKVLAGHKSFLGAQIVRYPLPPLPKAGPDDIVYSERCKPWRATETNPDRPYPVHAYRLKSQSGVIVNGVLPEDGWSEPIYTPADEPVKLYMTEFRIDQKITTDPYAAVKSKLSGAQAGVTPGTLPDRLIDIEGGD